MTSRMHWKRDRPTDDAKRNEALAEAIAGLSAARLSVLDSIDRHGWSADAHAIEVSLAVVIGDLMALEARLDRRRDLQ